MKVTIFGKGNMGQAIGKNFELAGNQVEYFGNGDKAENLCRLPSCLSCFTASFCRSFRTAGISIT